MRINSASSTSGTTRNSIRRRPNEKRTCVGAGENRRGLTRCPRLVFPLAQPSSPVLRRRRSTIARWVIALAFVAAGVLHFVAPEPYVRIVPPSLPAPEALVFWSGVFEVVGGLGLLLPPPVRRWAGWGLAALLVAVFPANLYMAAEGIGVAGVLGRAVLWARLGLQPFLIVWVLQAAGVVTAPGRSPGIPLPR